MKKFLRKLKQYLSRDVEEKLAEIQFAVGQNGIHLLRSLSNVVSSLWDVDYKVFSQWGEDGILDFLCHKLDISKPKVLEIGAGNFEECNSRFLVEMRNASAYLVDARKDLVNSKFVRRMSWKTHLFTEQTWVTPDNIDEIVTRAEELMDGIDIFSLDLDGNDYWILNNLKTLNFRVVVVEYNPLFGSVASVTVPRNDSFDRAAVNSSCLFYGASLKAYVELLADRGFTFVGTNRVGSNAFFVAASRATNLGIVIPESLDGFTDWRVREARDTFGRLLYTSGTDRNKIIENEIVVNLHEINTEVTVSEALKELPN